MGCNCKKVSEFQNKYGEKQDENYIQKISSFFKGLLTKLLIIPLILITVPIIVIILSYQLLFKKTATISIPKKLMEKLR